ncbi:uncharacterized protein LAJ45_01705 [Morchella importuna]|uniref:uncharacterized protein n=1 Tax=Morchella importuna TaxID=1174673 RepID=UPI001E8DB338|nr:uncharacterized protein LAJ45_01705 [Morchella importuna]KAH8153938.1 hypothetical protein LAJ45_01705 [Morchella importuna]
MDTGSNKGHLESSASSPSENDWEDIETGSHILSKIQHRLPRHRLLSYTCCLGKQRRAVYPYFCNPIVSKLSTEDDLQTFRNTVFNSSPLNSDHVLSFNITERHLMEILPQIPDNLTLGSSAIPKAAEQSTKLVKKISFSERNTIFTYNSYESKKRPLSPQPEPARHKSTFDSAECGEVVDSVPL